MGDKIKINLVGMGIGDGWMSPYHNARYANQLYQVGLMDEQDHDYCIAQEQTTQDLIDAGNLYEAWQSWNNEFGYFLTKMDCGYYYNIAICDFDPAEDNYEDFCNLASTREALHVGQMPFPNPGDVYFYIICNHSGILDMIADMQWDGKADYDKAMRTVY